MAKVKTTIEFSEDIYNALSAHGFSKESLAKESRKLLALKLYQDKVFSLGKAAEVAGLSKWDFIEFLSENNVPVLDYDELNLKREFKNVEKLMKRLK